ncbi:DNA polymerase delta, subunit 4-domain-containing protein [Amylostereum chailletii]|nr:DNA polymerase delta, subunit 4-domain-containing protein [Amylostereum chailletii]
MKRASSAGAGSSLKQQTLGFASAKRTASETKHGDKEKETEKGKEKGKGERRGTLSIGRRTLSREEDADDEEKEKEKERERERAARARLDVRDARWNRVYGLARAKMGHIEPVHAEGKNKVHHILRVFDTSYEYGPCVGVSRLQRWERAQALGLRPPVEVREILLTREGVDDPEYAQCVFYEAEKV